MADGGVQEVEVIAEAGEHPIPSPNAWWSAVLGSGYRCTLDQLDTMDRQKVRTANLSYIRDSGITLVEANVVYAIANKTRNMPVAMIAGGGATQSQ
jgi:hypothetical protein